jgi:hypothetical protein
MHAKIHLYLDLPDNFDNDRGNGTQREEHDKTNPKSPSHSPFTQRYNNQHTRQRDEQRDC